MTARSRYRKREVDGREWRDEEPPANTAPEWSADRADLTEWGVTGAEAAAMLRGQMCPACGRGPFKMILMHMSKAHGFDSFAVRDICGMTTTESLTSPDLHTEMSERGRGRDMTGMSKGPGERKPYRHTRAGLERLIENLADVTPEQSRANAKLSKTPEARSRQARSLRANWAKRRQS